MSYFSWLLHSTAGSRYLSSYVTSYSIQDTCLLLQVDFQDWCLDLNVATSGRFSLMCQGASREVVEEAAPLPVASVLASLCSCVLSPGLNLISSMRFSGKRFLIVTGSRYSQGISFSKSCWTLSWQRDSLNAPYEPANEMPGKAKKGKEKIEITAAISAWIIELGTRE